MTCEICERATPADADDELAIGMNHLIRAVSALGFDRARDAVASYGDEADPDQADWHPAFIEMVDTAIGVAADAAGEGGANRWLAFGPAPGQAVRWAWADDPGCDFAGIVLRSVHGLLGTDQASPAHAAALRLALPVMRRTAAEYLDSVMVHGDPATIAPAEWSEVAPDLDAIAAAEACVGRIADAESDRLDPILDAGQWRQAAAGEWRHAASEATE